VSIPESKLSFNAVNRMAVSILFTFFSFTAAHAQTIRPVITEYTAKVARGSFELVNPGVVPLNVILEPKSFTVSETGEMSYRPLDKGIQLKLSAMSFQIRPEQTYIVFYEARADALPAWFVIYANIGGYRNTSAGMNIRLDLPHTVYILPKHSVGKSDIAIRPLGYAEDKGHLNFLITNNGPWFGRVLSSEVTGKGGASQGSGFPVFPHSSRMLSVACKPNQTPTALRLHLKNFKMEEPLTDLGDQQVCAP
jgi:P pilus assembly chaperone PapD